VTAKIKKPALCRLFVARSGSLRRLLTCNAVAREFFNADMR
jgi:hypothetical protein